MPSADHKDLTVVLTGDQFSIPKNTEYNTRLSEPRNGSHSLFIPGVVEHTHTHFSYAIQVISDARICAVIPWAY